MFLEDERRKRRRRNEESIKMARQYSSTEAVKEKSVRFLTGTQQQEGAALPRKNRAEVFRDLCC